MKQEFFNGVYLKGQLTHLEWSYTDNDGIMHYSAILKIENSPNLTNYIPIYLTETLIKSIDKNKKNTFVSITGNIKIKKIRRKQLLYVSAVHLEPLEHEEYENLILLKGFISKSTSAIDPKSKVCLANYYITINQEQNYHIPVVAFKNVATRISNLTEGTKITLKGKLINKKALKSFDISSANNNSAVKINTLSFSIE